MTSRAPLRPCARRQLALRVALLALALQAEGALAQSNVMRPASPTTPLLEQVVSPGPTVVDLELHLPPGADPSGLPELIGIRRGQSLSRRAVRRSIERLYATGRFADVVVRREDVEGGVKVVFELTPRRVVTLVDVGGNRVLTDEEALAVARLSVGAEYYPERIDAAVAALTAAYQRRGYQEARIAADLTETPDGVEVLFFTEEGEPTRVSSLSVAGEPGLPLPRILEETGLSLGGVLNVQALEEGLDRLRALYRAERFYRARVGEPRIASGPGGAHVSLPVSAGPRFTFHFHGNRSIPDAILLAALGYDGDEALDGPLVQRLARRAESFYRLRGFHDVRISGRQLESPGGTLAIVAFDVEEARPLFVRAIAFEGNHRVSSEELRELLTGTIRSLQSPPDTRVRLLDDPVEAEGRSARRASTQSPEPETIFLEEGYRRAAEAMSALYRERGFLQARVELERMEIHEPHRSAEVTFRVHEGPQAMIREITYRGAPPGFDLRAAVTGVALRAGEPLRNPAVEAARLQLVRALGRAGYLFAQVDAESAVAPNGVDGRVVLQVESGPRVQVGQVIVQGTSRTEEALVRANVSFKEGQILDPEALFETQRNLVLLGIFRQVGVRLLQPEQPEAVKDVVVELKERPRFESEFRGGYFLVEGPRLQTDAVFPNLFGEGINFAARGRINYVGLSAQALAPQTTSKLVEPESLSGLQGIGGRGNLSLFWPRIYALSPFEIGARIDGVFERVHRPYYRFTRFAGIAGADWAATDWLSLSLQYELEHDRVQALPGVQDLLPSFAHDDQQRLRFPEGEFSLHGLRGGLTVDLRDDPVAPSRGILLSGGVELSHDLGAFQRVGGSFRETDCRTGIRQGAGGEPVCDVTIYTLKLSGALTGYLPVGGRRVLALSVRGGQILPLDSESKTIPPKRFFLGGGGSMRGFREDGLVPQDRRERLARERASCEALINKAGCTPAARLLMQGRELPSEGGELFALGKVELRFPAFSTFEVGLFAELGNLWLSQGSFDPFQLRYVLGAGLRYPTPIGPIALDFGFNLAPDRLLNEAPWVPHFSIGLF